MSTKKNKGQKSKDKIIDVALKLFSEKGYSNTSAQEIADLCEISQATVFYHFKNKKILFEEILKKVIKQNREIFEAIETKDLTRFDKLVALLEANIIWCHEFPEQTKVLLLLFYFASSDEEFKELAGKTIDRGRELVHEALAELNQEEPLQSQVEMYELAVIIQQYINSVMFQMLARTDSNNVKTSFNDNIRPFLRDLLYPNTK